MHANPKAVSAEVVDDTGTAVADDSRPDNLASVDRAVELWGRPDKTTSFMRHDTSEPEELKDNTLAVLEYDKSMAVISTAAKMVDAGVHRSFELVGSEGSFFIQPISGDRTM